MKLKAFFAIACAAMVIVGCKEEPKEAMDFVGSIKIAPFGGMKGNVEKVVLNSSAMGYDWTEDGVAHEGYVVEGGYRQEITYDEAGHILKAVVKDGEITNEYTFTYGEDGKVSSYTDGWLSDIDDVKNVFNKESEEGDEIIWMVAGEDGQAKESDHYTVKMQTLGQTAKIYYKLSDNDYDDVNMDEYSFNSAGLLVSAQNECSGTEYTYDDDGMLVKESSHGCDVGSEYERSYVYTKFDKHGNWTERTVYGIYKAYAKSSSDADWDIIPIEYDFVDTRDITYR